MIKPSSQIVTTPSNRGHPVADATTNHARSPPGGLIAKAGSPDQTRLSFLPADRCPPKTIVPLRHPQRPPPPVGFNLGFHNTWWLPLAYPATSGVKDDTPETFLISFDEVGGSQDPAVRLKSGRANSAFAPGAYPSYRLFSVASNAYVAKRNGSREVVAQSRNPFSLEIEWEWIPQPQRYGAILRNKASGLFLCFNKHGRPTARKQFKPNLCLIHGLIPRHSVVVGKTVLQSPTTPSNQTHRGIHKKPQSQAIPNSESPLMPRPLKGLAAPHPVTATAKGKRKGHQRRLRRAAFPAVLRSDSFPKLAIPSPVHLVSKTHTPPWYMGFCPQGRAFSNNRPYALDCPNFRLSRGWNHLFICPPVPTACRLPECQEPWGSFNIKSLPSLASTDGRVGRKCSRFCKMSLHCSGADVFRHILT